jgi:hypothetical protein
MSEIYVAPQILILLSSGFVNDLAHSHFYLLARCIGNFDNIRLRSGGLSSTLN